jgi:3-methyladenine DNA glycosylase/8-oxoguanine DNA glycosylase
METESDLTPSQRESAVWMVRSVFRLDEDLSHFYRLCWRQEKYRDLVAAGAGRILRAPTLFENLVKAICAANVQWKQAVLCINRLAAVGDPIPGTGLHLFPSAEQILSAGEQFLRDTVRIGYRTQSVLELAERSMETGFQGDLVEQGRLRGEDLRKFFLSIRGIGPVMAHSLLTLYGEYAYLPIDSSVIEMVQANHMNGVKPTRKQVKEIYHPYGKYQALILWYELARHFGWY